MMRFLFSVTVALMLAGCGGGSGGGAGGSGGPAGLAPTVGLTGIGPASIVSNAATPNRIADALPNDANKYKPLGTFVARDFNAGDNYGVGFVGPDVFELTEISSDGDKGFKLTYKENGTPTTVHLSKDNFSTTNPRYDENIDGITGYSYWLYSYTDAFNNGASNAGGNLWDYFDVNGVIIINQDSNVGVRGMALYGARTETANLPTGTAAYTGRMRANSYHVDDPISATSRSRIRSDATLSFDMSKGTVTGLLDNFSVRQPGIATYEPIPGQTVTLGDGKIVGGQFTAKLTGAGTVMGSFTGNALGEFYGPAGQEVGAALNGRLPSENAVFYGYIGADKE